MAEVMPQETQGFSLGKPTLVCRWRISGGMLPLANRHMRALRSRVVDGSRVSTELVAWGIGKGCLNFRIINKFFCL